MLIGFLINPIAGMGGRVGLKGTDGVVEEAILRGAQPVSEGKARQALRQLRQALEAGARSSDISWLTCPGAMGEGALRATGFEDIAVVHEAVETPTAEDTRRATAAFVNAGVDLIVFCGGDGTARDIAQIAGDQVPIVGIPSGVKMYSGIYGVSAERTGEIIAQFVAGGLDCPIVDILDLDEERYRKGEWAVRLVDSARTPYLPTCTQSSKALITEHADEAFKADIAEYLDEEIRAHRTTLFVLGPGSTVKAIAERLGIVKTLLGIDALLEGAAVGADLNENALLKLLDIYPVAQLILSPIGAQGFVLGRGNLQLSPAVVRQIGIDHLTVVATPAKLKRTPVLRFDTGDLELDARLADRRFLPVITGYRRRRLVPIST